MKRMVFILFLFYGCAFASNSHPWKGKRIAIIGDSMSDSTHIGTTKCYYEFLEDMIGVYPTSFAKNGARVLSFVEQAEQAYKTQQEKGFVYDMILVWGGTNDFRADTEIGTWYEYEEQPTNKDGKWTTFKHRSLNLSTNTFTGRLNHLMQYLKIHFPNSQIIIMTPIHRAYATFGSDNIQPDETFSNGIGLFIDDYVNTVKECGNVWAVNVIDLHALSGLYPLKEEYHKFFHDAINDKLHPNALGHYRIAKVIEAALRGIATDLILDIPIHEIN